MIPSKLVKLMDLGAVQGSSMGVAYHGARQANGTCIGHGQGGQSGQRLCHYCKQPGHFMISCKKLQCDMQMKRAQQQGGQANQYKRLQTKDPTRAAPIQWQQENMEG